MYFFLLYQSSVFSFFYLMKLSFSSPHHSSCSSYLFFSFIFFTLPFISPLFLSHVLSFLFLSSFFNSPLLFSSSFLYSFLSVSSPPFFLFLPFLFSFPSILFFSHFSPYHPFKLNSMLQSN